MGGPNFTRPDWVRRMTATGPADGGAEHLVPLDADELIATACRSTGLDDLGPDTWEEPLRRLVEALNGEAQLHVVGRLLCRHDLLRHLRTRLMVLDATRRDPSIGEEQVLAPVVVTGPARSGTSILHELLAEDPALRAPRAWEMAHPLPVAPVAERQAWAEAEFDLWSDIQPEFAAVHELAAHLPEECLWLLAPEFDAGFWSTCTDVPSFNGWRMGTDPLPAYRFHRLMLQVLQHDGDRRSWVLKSPVHLTRLAALFAVYPDARIVHTHRDPVKTIPSTVSTLVAGRWLRSDAVDVAATAAGIRTGLPFLYGMIVDQRPTLPVAQIADVQYLDLLRDPVGAITAAYEHLGMPVAPELPERIRSYLASRPQDKHGVHRYSCADHGSLLAAMDGAWPGVAVALDHCAFSPPEALRPLARHGNLHLKVSTHVLQHSDAPAALVRRLADAFGTDRLCWGSDFPQSAGGYAELVALARAAAADLDEDEAAAFLGGTAARLWFAT